MLPQEEGKPVKLGVPTLLQMGWVELPPYFCAASESARDVPIDYIETPIDLLLLHKFERWAIENGGNIATFETNKGPFIFCQGLCQ